ncbi:MAG: permease [Clostridia bacterium]|nr:permease [Clostridia bacterium]
MKKYFNMMKRYRLFLILLTVNFCLLFFAPQIGRLSFSITRSNLLEMLSVLPPIFILLGLIDVWIGKETMMKYMGDNSGLKGLLLAFTMGSAAAGPLYAAFPIAGMLLKKGVSISNVFIFVGAWSTTKIPMLLFEASSLGLKFTLIRLICSIVGIIAIAAILEKTTTEQEKLALYEKAK